MGGVSSPCKGAVTIYPAGFGQGIIAVGGSTSTDRVACASYTGGHLDVVAPSEGIRTTHTQPAFPCPCSGELHTYADHNGTSMAAPIVTGIAALLRSARQDLYNDDVEHLIQMSAEDLGTTGWDDSTGYGRVNANEALKLLETPYVLEHHSGSRDNTIGPSDYFGMWFLAGYLNDDPDSTLQDATYLVRRYEVRKSISWSEDLCDAQIWTDGVATKGYTDEEDPNYGIHFCEIVPGSLQGNSAVLRTYVYEVWTRLGTQFLGWAPCEPAQVQFTWSVLGRDIPALSAEISGPSELCTLEYGTWTAEVTGGAAPYTYDWWKRSGVLPWSHVDSDGSYTYREPGYNFWLKLQVASDCMVDVDSLYVTYAGICKEEEAPGLRNMFTAAGPNPTIDGTVELSFQMQEPGSATLEVFSPGGALVERVVYSHFGAGRHHATWSTRDKAGGRVASGVYFARLTLWDMGGSEKFVKTERIVLLR